MPPRIPEAELARLKREVSLERLVRARGVKLIRKGADLHGRCPMHEDKTPSLVVSPEENLWHCLGACQAGGSVLDWVMKTEGVSLFHAAQILREGLPLQDESRPVRAPKHSRERKLPRIATPDLEDQAVMKRVVDFYHRTLHETTEAKDYLLSRGLSHPELVDHFRLGFANRTLGYRLPSRDSEEGRAMRSRLQRLGVIRETGHEHLRGSLVVPLFDAHGQVVQLYGRKVNKVRSSAPHLYLPGPQRGVLNREALAMSEELVLTESILDALTFWCAGIRNVTCTYGAGRVHEDLEEALRGSGVRQVLIAYDRDKAGDAGAEKVAAKLQALGLAAYRVQFPKGMDASEYAQKVQPAAKSLAAAVRAALWMGEGKAPERAPPEALEAERETGEAEPPAPSEGAREAAKEEGLQGDGEEREAAEPGELEERGEDREPDQLPIHQAPTNTSPLEAAPLASPPEPSPPADEDPTEEDQVEEEEPLPPAPPRPPPRRLPELFAPDELVRRGEEHWLILGDRHYRVRGLERNLSTAVMKVNVLVRRDCPEPLPAGAGFHVDTLDLYLSRPREAYVKRAAVQLGCEEATVERDLGRLLVALEAAQDEAMTQAMEPKAAAPPPMTDAEREEALALLRSPDLLGQILRDFEACGIVGEEVGKLAGYLAATSRKLERPLAIVVQSNSAAGKSSLMEAVLRFMPEEETVSYSAMTGQSLFYMSGKDLRHKILSVAEEEGAQRASYALKLLQSEGKLRIASTGKDATTGRLMTEDYEVEGPVAIFLTTTATDLDEELLNRCLVLAVDEGRAQTEAIHRRQRKARRVRGRLQREERAEILKRHQNAQRLLAPIWVDNPYAEHLTFQAHQTRFRRDHEKYLTLIETIALLHQHQRPREVLTHKGRSVPYVSVTEEDVRLANELAHEVLGRSVDELPPQTRRLLDALNELVTAKADRQALVREDVRFTRREVREATGLGNSQVATHLDRLEELEYLLVHAGGRGRSIVYELLGSPSQAKGGPRFAGLKEVGAVSAEEDQGEGEEAEEETEYEPNLPVSGPHLPGPKGEFPGSFRPLSGAFPGGFRGGASEAETLSPSTSSPPLEAKKESSLEDARLGSEVPRAQTPPVVVRPDRAPKANGSKLPE